MFLYRPQLPSANAPFNSIARMQNRAAKTLYDDTAHITYGARRGGRIDKKHRPNIPRQHVTAIIYLRMSADQRRPLSKAESNRRQKI